MGLDLGTTRIKAVLLDASGVEHADGSAPTPFGASADGVDLTVADLRPALEAVFAQLGGARRMVAAVGVAGMAESGAPFRSGQPAGPIIAWHDGRGAETVASLEAHFGPDLARRTGRRVRSVSSVAKLGWLIEHGLPAPDRWLGVPELVLWLLTGAESTEHSLAARTGAYDVIERRFLPEVIGHVLTGWDSPPVRAAEEARPLTVFPPVRTAGSVMGVVTQEGSHQFGVPVGVPVTIAGHDHLAAAAGLGGRPDDLFNSVGTAETLVRRLDAAPDVNRALELDLAVTVWPGADAWGVFASAARSGLVIEALAAHLGIDPAGLDALAKVGTEPWRGGTGQMVGLGQAIEVPVGPPAEMWSATLRALARRTAAAADRVAALAGPHRRLVVFGGGSRNSVWLEDKAAGCGVPVLGAPVKEAAARGAALAAGVAAAWWPTVSAGPIPPLDAGGARAGTMGSA